MGSSVLADHPLLADVRALPLVELGRSVEGRPILGAVFEAGRGATWLGPARAAPLLVVGGVHGDEPSSVEAVAALARRIFAGAAWAAAVAAACAWPGRKDLGYPTPGPLGSWLGVDRGLPVLTLELPPGPLATFGRQAAAALDEAVRPRESLCDSL